MKNHRLIASKLVDIQKGFQDIQVGLPHLTFDKSITIGKASRLAANMRTLEVIKPISRLDYVAIEMGITPSSLRLEILPLLDSLGFIEKHYDGSGKLDRIEENIPQLDDLLRVAGNKWEELEPNQEERAGVQILMNLSKSPIDESDLRTQYSSIPDRDFETLITCVESGNLIGKYQSSAEDTIIYSPLVWSENANQVMQFYSKLGDVERDYIFKLSQDVQKYPGLPTSKIETSNPSFTEALSTGFIEKGTTLSKSGSHGFLFFPDERMKLDSEGVNRVDLFDKVKTIISAVRHGEHFAPIWKIKYPVLILQKLLDKGYLNPYSGAREQYALLELKGIVRFEKVDDRWMTTFVESKENKEAMQAAIDILMTGEPITRKLKDDAVQGILVDGFFIDPVRQRSRTRRTIKITSQYIESFLEGARGEKYDFKG